MTALQNKIKHWFNRKKTLDCERVADLGGWWPIPRGDRMEVFYCVYIMFVKTYHNSMCVCNVIGMY